MNLCSERLTCTRRRKGEYSVILVDMAGSRCRVSFIDFNGVLHGVYVDAESLYESVAVAVAQFREDDVSPSDLGQISEFTVAVYRNPTEHSIRLGPVTKWAEHTTKEGPAGIRKGERVDDF